MTHLDAYPNPWFYDGLPMEVVGPFVSMWVEDGPAAESAGRARLLQSHREWLGRLERGEATGLVQRALGVMMVHLLDGTQGVLFAVGGRDGVTATFGEISTGQVRSTPGEELCPIELADGDSNRPMSGRWFDARSGWFLAHKGYVDPDAYGHLRSRRRDDGVPRAIEELCERTGLEPAVLASAVGDSIVRRVRDHMTTESILKELGDATTDDGQDQYQIGDEGEVVITLLPDVVEVAEYAVVWHGAHLPVRHRRRRGSVSVPLLGDRAAASVAVADAIKVLRRSRRRRFRRCTSCRQLTPPEHWFGDGYCSECATSELGVVY